MELQILRLIYLAHPSAIQETDDPVSPRQNLAVGECRLLLNRGLIEKSLLRPALSLVKAGDSNTTANTSNPFPQ